MADVLEAHDFAVIEDGFDFDGVLLDGALDDGREVGAGGVLHQDLHQEAIELRFGKGISAFHFDGVLGCHHEEGLFENVCVIAAGDGVLLHRFEQGGLGFRSGAVDLVSEDQVRKDGSGNELENLAAVLAGIHHGGADDVTGHEVRRELYTGILEVQDAG